MTKIGTNNRPGDIVDAYKFRIFGKPVIVQLIEFKGHITEPSKTSVQLVKRDSRGLNYAIEMWTGIDVKTSEVREYRLPVILGYRIGDEFLTVEESSMKHRPDGDYVNNFDEVNLLQDTYEEFLDGRRTYRDNFHLRIEKNKHQERLIRLVDLIEREENPKMKHGLLLHYMQKDTPTYHGKLVYERWCRDNPRLFNKLVENVYNSTANISI